MIGVEMEANERLVVLGLIHRIMMVVVILAVMVVGTMVYGVTCNG